METIKRLMTATVAALWLVHTVGVAEDAAPATAAARAKAAADTFPPEQIEQLVAPIALYPDALLAQIFMAATYPLDIVQADRWLDEHQDLKDQALTQAAAEEGWDPSVQALVLFPAVLAYMSDNLNWTQDLGDAVLAQQDDVMAAVQRLRKEAEAAGNLKTTEQQRVESKGDTIVVQPADPEVVYVPSYNPATVYGQTEPPATTYYPSTYSEPVYVPESYVATTTPVYTTSPADAWLGFGVGALAGGMLTAAILWDDVGDHLWRAPPPRPGVPPGRGYWGGANYWNNGWNNPTAINQNIAASRNIQTGDITVNRGISGNDIQGAKWQHNPERRGGVRYRNPETRAKYDSARREARLDPDRARGREPGQGGGLQRPDGGGRVGDGTRPGADRRPGEAKRPATGDRMADAKGPGRDGRGSDVKRGDGSQRAGAKKPTSRPANVQKPKVSRPEGGAAQRPAARDSARTSGFQPQAGSFDRAASQRGAASRGGGGLSGFSGGGASARPTASSRQGFSGSGAARPSAGGGGARASGGRAAGGGGGRGGGGGGRGGGGRR